MQRSLLQFPLLHHNYNGPIYHSYNIETRETPTSVVFFLLEVLFSYRCVVENDSLYQCENEEVRVFRHLLNTSLTVD